MGPVTAARCPGCGYENNPYYRYCGMCGSPLKAGEPALPAISEASSRPAEQVLRVSGSEHQPPATRTKAPPVSISGFSVLGLGDPPSPESAEENFIANSAARSLEPTPASSFDSESGLTSSRGAHYLLEDDEPRPRTRMYVALAILLVAAATLLWHWQTSGYPWESVTRESSAHRTSPMENKPAPANSSVPPANPDSPPPAAAQSTPPNSAPPSAADPVANPAPVSPDAGNVAAPATTDPAPTVTNPPEPIKDNPAPAARKPEPHAPSSQPKPTPAALTEPAQLFLAGEKFLYGDGVPQDCDRAQKNLRTSAAHSYPQAESLLGTMYASGHCLGRDLPAAYRWYARALHHEPGNSRIASDLQVLWSEMTPAERKAAQASGQ